MPNWCYNNVTLRHADPLMIERAVKAIDAGKFLQEFIPCPDDLIDTVCGAVGMAGTPEQNELEDKQRSNIEKYGYPTWYEFCTSRWGCKWDVHAEVVTQESNYIAISFDSAWAPPLQAFRELTAIGFEVDALYYEPGMAFCGHYTSEDDDECYDIIGDSDWVENNIPDRINSVFCISEQMAEYESEEEMNQEKD